MHFQSYKNAPLQGETQSSLLLRRQCQQDGGHHSPKSEETALQAGRREVQEYPQPTILLGLAVRRAALA